MQGTRAGLVSRCISNSIDGTVITLLVLVGYLAVAGFIFIFDPRDFRFPQPHIFLTSGLWAVAAIVYLALGWWINGRTPGKQVVGLRVVATMQTRLGLGASLVRAVTCVIFPAGLVWSAFSVRNASIQDRLVNTAVIYDWEKHLAPRRS